MEGVCRAGNNSKEEGGCGDYCGKWLKCGLLLTEGLPAGDGDVQGSQGDKF